jgi:hypothetical protein
MRKQTGLIMLALVVVGVLVVSGTLPLLSVSVETKGVGYYHHGWRGGSNDNGGGDLLDASSYVTSWTGGGASEKIVLTGAVKAAGNILDADFSRYYYKVTLDVNNENVKINGVTGTTWTSDWYDAPGTYVTSEDWFYMKTMILTITNPCSGKVTAEFYGHHHWNWGINGGTDVFASDEAYLRPGVGSVKVQDDVVEEGTDASFYVETGYAHSTKATVPESDQGWVLNVYNPNGQSVLEKTVSDNFAGTVKWSVPSGAYSESSTNVYRVILRNELLDQDDDWFFTVGPGMKEQVPTKPTFELVTGEEPFVKGESVTVRVSAEKTYNDISGFWVWVSYETSAGTTTEYIYKQVWYSASTSINRSFADVTFTFPEAGNVRLEASAVDVKNLNSGISECKFTVNGFNGNVTPPPTDWSMVILGAVIILIGLLIYWKAPYPQFYKLILMVVLIGVGIYLMYPTLVGG